MIEVTSYISRRFIQKGYLGDWSPEKDCCLRLTFRQPVLKPSPKSSDSLSQLKI